MTDIAKEKHFSLQYKMSEKIESPTKKSFSLDWLMRGVLTKIGETFDGLTGRKWKPSSSLATSELIERLKSLLDAEAKETDGKVKFVPHNIKLKMQWDKFSTDAETALKKLENELLIAAIDHINDRRYQTYAPMKLEIKPDYFTEGVKLLTSFDKFADEEREAAVNVSVPDSKNVLINPVPEIAAAPEKEVYAAEFAVGGKTKRVELSFADRERKSVGRTKENDLQIDDASVSKIHAALVLNSEKNLMVADTGSTNGTFVNSQRIAYGKATLLNSGDKLKFGTVEVALERIVKEIEETSEPAAENANPFENFNTSEAAKTGATFLPSESAPNVAPSDKSNAAVAPSENNQTAGRRIVLDFDEKT